MQPSRLLILTNSRDLTVDRLIRRIGTERIFRFNFDAWDEYAFAWDRRGFRLSNPTGGTISQADVAKCLWRKPLSRFRLEHRPGETVPEIRRFIETEVNAFMVDMASALWRDNKLVLIEPDARARTGKFVQLQTAPKYFSFPDFCFSYPLSENTLDASAPLIVKSISGERVSGNKGLYTTLVDSATLDPKTPWFLQRLAQADSDVTVAHVIDTCFAFELDRGPFKQRTLDWREVGHEVIRQWRPIPLPPTMDAAIKGFMREIGLHYGRLDFVVKDNEWQFLEINPNGEWDWLDPDKGLGLFDRILEAVHPDTPLMSLPHSWASGLVVM